MLDIAYFLYRRRFGSSLYNFLRVTGCLYAEKRGELY